MQYGYYPAFDELRRMLQWQGQKLLELEKEIAELKELIQQNEETMNRTHVEKMEYHFEQLKVENLNGALHIGISPGDAAVIEDLLKEGQYTADVTAGGKENGEVGQESALQGQIHEDIIRYIRDAIPPQLQSRQLTEEQIRAAMEDMIRQTGERISLYLQHFKQAGETDHAKLKDTVIERIKADVFDAVERYIEHFHKEEEK